MDWLLENVDSLRSFMDAGGPVLWVVAGMATLIGFLVFERYWYTYLVYPAEIRQIVQDWQRLKPVSAWHAQRIRASLVSECEIKLRRNLPLIKGFVALCPLLGLLGTVTGMIDVFDVVAIMGTGNTRAMASGISRATIPTMAGLVVALPGLYFTLQLDQISKRKAEYLADQLLLTTGAN